MAREYLTYRDAACRRDSGRPPEGIAIAGRNRWELNKWDGRPVRQRRPGRPTQPGSE
jgi:hypothetical protein